MLPSYGVGHLDILLTSSRLESNLNEGNDRVLCSLVHNLRPPALTRGVTYNSPTVTSQLALNVPTTIMTKRACYFLIGSGMGLLERMLTSLGALQSVPLRCIRENNTKRNVLKFIF